MALMEYFEYQVMGKIIFGADYVDSMGMEIDRLGMKRPLIVTDQILEEIGLSGRVWNAVESSSAEVAGVFKEVPPNSEVKVIREAYEMALDQEADSIITVGGGSVIDTGKGLAILMSEGGELLDHQSAFFIPTGKLPFHISIPTTAGTGSESTFAAVIKDNEQEIKLIFQGPEIAPSVAVLDPTMTKSLPPQLTAATGMDALTHAIESLHSQMAEPITDGISLHAIRLIINNIRKATENGDDLEARSYMLIAANQAGVAFANAFVGAVHAMAHSLGGRFGVPHGLANSILLPYVMEYNLESVPHIYAQIAEALGADVRGDDDITAARKGIDIITQLTKDLGLTQKLSEVNVPREGLTTVAEDSMIDGCMLNNPREAEMEEIEELFEKAY